MVFPFQQVLFITTMISLDKMVKGKLTDVRETQLLNTFAPGSYSAESIMFLVS
jgi:hypothetical protein